VENLKRKPRIFGRSRTGAGRRAKWDCAFRHDTLALWSALDFIDWRLSHSPFAQQSARPTAFPLWNPDESYSLTQWWAIMASPSLHSETSGTVRVGVMTVHSRGKLLRLLGWTSAQSDYGRPVAEPADRTP